jgi:hypothetical protein
VLYGLPKIHKKDVPLRPIISAVQTYNYKLAKYLDEILKPLVNKEYMLKDSFDFVNKVAHLNPEKDKFLVSFDVESLFTNIPTVETIDIIIKLAYPRNTKWFHDLTKDELRRLLLICTTKSHFQFDKVYYEQVDGVAMGSPLGPLFANVFMSDFENKLMKQLKNLGVKTWLRYVDDIFATLENKEDAEKILEFLNNQHGNIKFTIEHETDGKQPFLDTEVERHIGKYTTTVYHKPTFTGVYLNWTSLTARRYKIGLIKCLTKRILLICSDENARESHLKKLKQLLLRNQYPSEVIEREINICLEKYSSNNNKKMDVDPNQVKSKKRFIVLPYVSKKCEDFARNLKKVINNSFPSIEMEVAFQAPKYIANYFPYKDKIERPEEHANVVYHIKCLACDADYIGKTKRILIHRIKEHNKIESSACAAHMVTNPGHHMDFENINIIDQASNDMKLKIKELLHIIQKKPKLNKQLSSQSSYEIQTLLIQAYPQFQPSQNK